MRTAPIVLALLISVASHGMEHKQAECKVTAGEMAQMLAASYQEFDQEMKPGSSWRTLFMNGCLGEAADVIGRYIDAHGKQLKPDELRHLHFHRGQTLAFAGRNAEAIPQMKESLTDGATKEWRAYVDATIAFLAADENELRRARSRYAALVGSDSFRLTIVDNLINCFGKSYAEAAHCPNK